jgi:hypothetical protein
MADNSKPDSAWRAIIVAVVVALIAGGSAPWWIKYLSGGAAPRPAAANLPPGSSMGPLEFNSNRSKSDMNTGMEVQLPDDCRTACAQNADCRAMTFVAHPAGQSGGICWLKTTAPAPTPQQGMTSAVKFMP